MDIQGLLDTLRYSSSPNCLQGKDLDHAPDYGHVFRRAQETVHLVAVYSLRPPLRNGETSTPIPIVYVCRAASLDEADEFHRLVWNQNIIPFLVVLAPQGVRVYSGFERRGGKGQAAGQELLIEQRDFAKVATALAPVTAESIDSGAVWEKWGDRIRPQQRVEWRLLKDLEKIEGGIVAAGLTDPKLVHALIGKFVYLYYLRHRQVLSDERLRLWDLNWDDVAGRSAKLTSFGRLCDELDERLNGSIFPLSKTDLNHISATVLQRIADVFAGGTADGQLPLGFDVYDFSHIPIETLSVIYEQFLHHKRTDGGSTAGQEQAAYYTPIPVVNFIIDRMNEIKPLRAGMRVLDFSCGSGAFLVQCYRKLIEDQVRSDPRHSKPRPVQLRDLLVKHIFGIDVDDEACRVARLSLLLTLLDYLEAPDLLTSNGQEQRFLLPNLADNIAQANAFDDAHEAVKVGKAKRFDWIIGNPPWKPISSKTKSNVLQPVLHWIIQHKEVMPTGGNEAAEAFAWRVGDFAAKDALAGLLMPAMALFKNESRGFRRQFFTRNPLAYVANFANLAEVLFPGPDGRARSRVPAAAMIFLPVSGNDQRERSGRIPVFSPLVANQEPTRPRTLGERVDSWSLVINEGEIRYLTSAEIKTGEALTWKIAAWGSHIDQRLLRRLSRLASLKQWADRTGLTISEGPPLRESAGSGGYPVAHHPELAGRNTLITASLTGLGHIFAFPSNAIRRIDPDETYVPTRSGYERPESICRPPHIIISAARNWAVFSDDYLVVPPRQIGIAGTPTRSDHRAILKALASYLNSDFFLYHQFFLSPQFGVQRQVSTLDALLSLPLPPALVDGDAQTLEEWGTIYDSLVALITEPPTVLHADDNAARQAGILATLNQRITGGLSLHHTEATRISDFVNVILGLRDGKVEQGAVRVPTEPECRRYAATLKSELDAFVGAAARALHAVEIWRDEHQSMGVIRIDLEGRNATVVVHPRGEGIAVIRQAVDLRRALESHDSQWRYFNRNLRLFFPNRIYLFKPMQRFHWLESQAVLDASEVIGLVLDRTQRSQ